MNPASLVLLVAVLLGAYWIYDTEGAGALDMQGFSLSNSDIAPCPAW